MTFGKWLLAATASLAAMHAAAQEFPSKSITLIVPFAPGGLADLVGRVLAAQMEKTLRQPVVVTNRPGAGGAIGASAVARAPADGYTLLISLTSHVILPEADRMQGKVPAYELAQFQPVARITYEPTVLMGAMRPEGSTVEKIVARARAKPGTVSYSSTGYFANAHVGVDGFAQAAGIQLLHVPYQGGSQALMAVASGQVDLSTGGPATAATFAKSGKVRALAILGDERLSSMPDVPTLKELGYDSTYYVWSGLFAPAGTPPKVMAALRASVRAAVNDADFQHSLKKMEATLAYQDASEFDQFLVQETGRLYAVVRKMSAPANR
ncbi:MAG: tripartite tricarboxylate transporter substrate binding protein [Pigmentiphaga sp.]|uniref:tripartite tricarboxylate transporter substrate binding protein n=1 Tax=Pigmentiphaga sp. TaxID=1977564 RepID=UPI0029BA0290|nr:tripartite tricarboxylate transporter substrate binding protein [Pigmentiphaga sp.]MDX3905125.1 tripartite tricarboxylate transporter substrate binding protein [Pigmentiphaga sp.]